MKIRIKLNVLICLGLTVMAVGASAQIVTDPDWKESEAPAPPAFRKERVLTVEMPKYVSLRFGVDPATLSITSDGVVRYVMVAINAAGTINAMYEGIRCATGEFKTYARYDINGQWVLTKDPDWHNLRDNLPSRHALALASQGACTGNATAHSTADIVNALKNPGLGQSR
jgi:hypothetical protein